jgi:hypothetical protein
MQIAD